MTTITLRRGISRALDNRIGLTLIDPRGALAWAISRRAERLASLAHRICEDCPDYDEIREDAAAEALRRLVSSRRVAPDGWFTVDMAAVHLGASEFKICNAISSQAIAGTKEEGGRLLISEEALQSWHEAGRPDWPAWRVPTINRTPYGALGLGFDR